MGWSCGSGLPLTHLLLIQGLHYQYFELGKNVDPEQESDLHFQSAFTVHPVLDPVQMYRLHKYFAQVELERTYQEIQQLQVRADLAGWDLGNSAVTFQSGSPFCPHVGAFRPTVVLGWDQLFVV